MAVPVILVVDDEASIRRTLREILEYEDFAVEEAEDGEAALDKLRSERFDVMLLDVINAQKRMAWKSLLLWARSRLMYL